MKSRAGVHQARRASLSAALLLFFPVLFLVLASCKEGTFYAALGDQLTTTLSIAPASGTIVDGSSLTFSANGGAPPYSYSLVSGPGTVDASTGVFTTNGGGTVVVRVTDKNRKTSDAQITVTPTGLLTINPTPVSVNVNGTIQFVAAGGMGPYTFAITSAGSGNPTITSDGRYTSGFTTPAKDEVTVTDAHMATKTATITVTATVTNVDYTIQSITPPAGGTGGKPVAVGYGFTVLNSGGSAGSRPINWWVYVSDSSTFGTAGMQILTKGVAMHLAPSDTIAITPTIGTTGTWPVVPLGGATKYLFFQIAADDDLNSVNNIAGPSPPAGIRISSPSVDYSVTSFTQTGPLIAGGPISESFTLQNNGTDTGSQSVQWTAYVSSDSLTTISEGDKVIDAGTYDLLGVFPAAIAFHGTWPSAHGPYHLKVKLSAADDTNTTNNIQPSAAVYNTTHVDYTVSSVTATGPYLAGNAITASFSLQNVGNANGSQTVSWSAYVSTNSTLDPGDTLVASGTTDRLDSSVLSTVQITPITGTWPSNIDGTYYIVVAVAAADDTGPAANVGASTGCLLTAPTVDYVVSSVANPLGSTLPAGSFTGSFQLNNTGVNNGSQLVNWSVYASLTTAVGGAILVATGVWQPLLKGTNAVIPFSASWPLHYGDYHLVVSASAAFDVESNPPDNVAATAGTTPVGVINEKEPNDDATALSPPNVQDMGVTLKPGMSILVSRILPGSDFDDVFAFNTGTAASVSLYMSWPSAGGQNVTLRFKKDLPVVTTIASATIAAGNSLSLSWDVDVASKQRWIDANNAGGETAYTLIITGN